MSEELTGRSDESPRSLLARKIWRMQTHFQEEPAVAKVLLQEASSTFGQFEAQRADQGGAQNGPPSRTGGVQCTA